MSVYFITFRSVTLAQRGEQVLRQKGIRCSLQRTPRWMEEQGCGYCLRVRMEDIGSSVQLLRQGQILFRKIYVQTEDGSVEEVKL
ncbi:MAG: DUF3343 domain-containing protein [Oscillospiraceae bacterium]|nr:DUF3343 domain-containing protein [Oscillospiraceae bacterium]